ncbi:transposase [Rhodocaloribacter litoris]|nr:transposase [Rhodocaloribacter litoris]QXD17184.1 transposase [Rhodocaloribacter litoris]
MEQATDALQVARTLIDAGLPRDAVNRAYYAIFYGVLALLVTRRLGTSKHSGALTLFSREFVKKGLLPPEMTRLARRAFDALAEAFEDKGAARTRRDAALEILEAGLEDAIAVLVLPAKYRRRLRTTNMLERLNEELRRREGMIRIFPNEAAALRLIGALLVEQQEYRISGKRYFNMDEYESWRQARQAREEQEGVPATLRPIA